MSGEAGDKASALRRAKELGCSGAHQHPNGSWMACESHEEYERLEKEQGEKSVLGRMHDFQSVRERKGKKKKAKNKKNWEKLGERGVVAIDTISAGLVSGVVGGKAASSLPTSGDEDVFNNARSARRRARQLGCIGIARRTSLNGNTVWTPCSNITDYARQSGSTALGRRYQDRREQERAERAIREQERRRRRKLRRKISLTEELNRKSLVQRARFDPDALDGDNDGIVQDGTPFARPNVRKVGKAVKKAAEAAKPKQFTDKDWHKLLARDPGWLSEAPASARNSLPSEVQEAYDNLRAGMRSGRIGAGGRQASQTIIGKVKPEHRNKPAGSRKMHFVGGTVSAGKTSLVDNGTIDIPGDTEAAFIDPDWIKTQLVGWNNGAGAGQVHPASRQITDRVMNSAADEGMDMVVTGTGKRTEHLRWAKQKGYQNVGHFVHIPGDVADTRLAERNRRNSAEGGPVLPGHYGSQIGRELQMIVPRQITSGLYDEFYLWNNNVQPPSLIAKRTQDGAFEIADDAAFDEFMGPQGARYVRNYWQQNQ